MKVDVVIPAHDAGELIEDAISSAREQTLSPARIIVVADACSDDTARRARRAGAEVLEIAARSAGAARNAGVLASSAPFVAFLDADDVWFPDWLELAAKALARAPSAVLAYGGVHEEDERGHAVRVAPAPALEGDVFEALLAKDFITTSAVVCRREALIAVGAFETSLLNGEDWDLWLRLASRADVVPVRGVHVRYRRLPGSVSRSPDRLLRARDDALRVIDRAAGLRPVSRKLLRRARAQVLAFSAMRLLSIDAPRAARIDLQRALELCPNDRALWLMSLLSAAPPSFRHAALAARRHLRLLGRRA